jgi:hypothetical protein
LRPSPPNPTPKPDAPPAPRPKRRRPANDADRRRVGRLVAIWGGVTLGGVTILAALLIWHLVRRGRLIRDRLGPPKLVQWPEPDESRPPDETTT